MKLPRFSAEPSALLSFFEEGLQSLGAVCERSWHDRLEVLAEGPAAKLWRADGSLHSTELHFPTPDAPGLRDAATQAFAGCPLTFQLIETLWRRRVPQFRACLVPPDDACKPPAPAVAEKRWHKQFGQAANLDSAVWSKAWHFSMVALVRCEAQAIDQTWTCHRFAISLSDGQQDTHLETDLDYCAVESKPAEPVPWPELRNDVWHGWLASALTSEIEPELREIKRRQEAYLERELQRIDEYFLTYQQELELRRSRQQKEEARSRYLDRLRAAQGEHARRRDDQARRHEVRIIPHLDALLLAAEQAWQTEVRAPHGRDSRQFVFVPRARRWFAALTPIVFEAGSSGS